MTHSYATRAWALHQMSNDYFGLQTIAAMACIKPRTLQSWFRQETRRAKFSLKMPREYERAMAIILLDLLPCQDDQIASLVFTNVRTLREWRVENRYRPYNSDLTLRTSEGVVILQPLVEKTLKKYGQVKFLAGRMLWPDPNLIYEETWRELDELFYRDLVEQRKRYLRSTKKSKIGPSHKIKNRVFVGPHFMRYTEISREGQHFPLESFQSQRPIKHLIGAGGLEAQGLAKISDQLLPCDWKMKSKVVPIKSKAKAKASTKNDAAVKVKLAPQKLKGVG
jgi:hypothetical protein